MSMRQRFSLASIISSVEDGIEDLSQVNLSGTSKFVLLCLLSLIYLGVTLERQKKKDR
jgi:hypothetical protein